MRAARTLPLSGLPATVSRDANVEHATVTVTLPAPYAGMKITSSLRSADRGQIGTMTRVGNQIVGRFTGMAYTARAATASERPDDPSPETGARSEQKQHAHDRPRDRQIRRDFRWLLGGTSATYNGQHMLSLADHGKSGIAGARRLGPSTYEIEVITRWQIQVPLRSSSLNGSGLSLSGASVAQALSDGRFVLTFRSR